jgi:hypothetical protein
MFMLEQANSGLHPTYAPGQTIRLVASAQDLRVYPDTA